MHYYKEETGSGPHGECDLLKILSKVEFTWMSRKL